MDMDAYPACPDRQDDGVASTTKTTKPTTQRGSSEIGQARSPILRSRFERIASTGVSLAATSTWNLGRGQYVLPSVPDRGDKDC